jgi:hypothetical protein
MQRFFFDLQFDDEKPSEDEEGTLLPDVEAAQLEAARSLSDFSRAIVDDKERLHKLSARRQWARSGRCAALRNQTVDVIMAQRIKSHRIAPEPDGREEVHPLFFPLHQPVTDNDGRGGLRSAFKARWLTPACCFADGLEILLRPLSPAGCPCGQIASARGFRRRRSASEQRAAIPVGHALLSEVF